MSALVIDQWTADKAEELCFLHQRSFNRPGDERWSSRAFADVLQQARSFCLIARHSQDADPFAFAVTRVMADSAELLTLGVLPQQRRQGVALRLVKASMALAHQLGAREMFLEVATDNPDAFALYRTLGFEQVGRRPGYYERLEGRRIDGLTMSIPLAAATTEEESLSGFA